MAAFCRRLPTRCRRRPHGNPRRSRFPMVSLASREPRLRPAGVCCPKAASPAASAPSVGRAARTPLSCWANALINAWLSAVMDERSKKETNRPSRHGLHAQTAQRNKRSWLTVWATAFSVAAQLLAVGTDVRFVFDRARIRPLRQHGHVGGRVGLRVLRLAPLPMRWRGGVWGRSNQRRLLRRRAFFRLRIAKVVR